MLKVSHCLQPSDPPAAIRLARDSLQMLDPMIASKIGGNKPALDRAYGLRKLGEAQFKAGRFAEARSSADLALAASRAFAQIPDEHLEIVEALILSGNASAATRDPARAENLLIEARQTAQELARSGELTGLIPLAHAEKALGSFYLSQHRTREARDCYQRLVTLWQQFPESNEYVDAQRVSSQRLLSSLR
jgi:tetratricopeptide (TPR) repeat protein